MFPATVSASTDRIDPIRIILRAEGAVALVLAVVAFSYLGYSWWLFATCILLPDLGMIGYVRDPRIGALTYNAVHTYIAPALLGLVGWLAAVPLFFALAAIWVAHIGLDRVLGFGLKLPTGFKDTHLSVRR